MHDKTADNLSIFREWKATPLWSIGALILAVAIGSGALAVASRLIGDGMGLVVAAIVFGPFFGLFIMSLGQGDDWREPTGAESEGEMQRLRAKAGHPGSKLRLHYWRVQPRTEMTWRLAFRHGAIASLVVWGWATVEFVRLLTR